MTFHCLLCALSPSLEWIDQQDFAKKVGVGLHFFTLKFECHNWHYKMLVYNSASGHVAWCNKNNSQWGFCVFFQRTKPISFQKNKKPVLKKIQGFSQPWLFFNPFLWFSLDRTIWSKSRHYQFGRVCAAHLEWKSLVMKKLRTTGIWIRKNWCYDNKTSFEKWNPCRM